MTNTNFNEKRTINLSGLITNLPDKMKIKGKARKPPLKAQRMQDLREPGVRISREDKHKKSLPEKKPFDYRTILNKEPTKCEILQNFVKQTRKFDCDERKDLSSSTMNKKINIVSWNINGLRNIFDAMGSNKKDELTNLLNDRNIVT